MDAVGAHYGTTSEGGGCRRFPIGCGRVFELMPPPADETRWTEKVLYRFTGRDGDGAYPVAVLIN
jgi:hypothetical protein